MIFSFAVAGIVYVTVEWAAGATVAGLVALAVFGFTLWTAGNASIANAPGADDLGEDET